MTIHNTPGMIAGVWGFLLGGTFLNTLVVSIAFIAHAPQAVIYVLGGIVTGSIIIGGSFLLCMEYVNPSVRTPGEFIKIVALAARYACMMPLVIPAILILLITWRMIVWTFIWLYIVPRIQREFNVHGGALNLARP